MTKSKIKRSTGNIFADIGVQQPEEVLAKANIIHAISRIIEKKGLTQKEAAQKLGTDQAKVSALMNGQLYGFSMERLLNYLILLNQNIEIRIQGHKPANKNGEVRVLYA